MSKNSTVALVKPDPMGEHNIRRVYSLLLHCINFYFIFCESIYNFSIEWVGDLLVSNIAIPGFEIWNLVNLVDGNILYGANFTCFACSFIFICGAILWCYGAILCVLIPVFRNAQVDLVKG